MLLPVFLREKPSGVSEELPELSFGTVKLPL